MILPAIRRILPALRSETRKDRPGVPLRATARLPARLFRQPLTGDDGAAAPVSRKYSFLTSVIRFAVLSAEGAVF